jgi:hypothetical protein
MVVDGLREHCPDRLAGVRQARRDHIVRAGPGGEGAACGARTFAEVSVPAVSANGLATNGCVGIASQLQTLGLVLESSSSYHRALRLATLA